MPVPQGSKRILIMVRVAIQGKWTPIRLRQTEIRIMVLALALL